jgi:putative hydroxymethylpyrimidine transport system permease protein
MLHANSRMQVDLMFAACWCWPRWRSDSIFSVDAGLKRLLPWHPANPETETD